MATATLSSTITSEHPKRPQEWLDAVLTQIQKEGKRTDGTHPWFPSNPTVDTLVPTDKKSHHHASATAPLIASPGSASSATNMAADGATASIIGSNGFQCVGPSLGRADADRIGLAILHRAKFTTVAYRGTPLPRWKWTAVKRGEDGWEPVYRYPGFSYAYPTEEWKDLSELDELVGWCEAQHAASRPHRPFHRPNHAIVTLYRNQKDNISAHSDKVLDIEPDSEIYDFSFFATRPIDVVNTKTGATQSHPLEHGAFFVLDAATNQEYTHAINAQSTPCGPRMSVVLRCIRTRIQRGTNGDIKMNGKLRWSAQRHVQKVVKREEDKSKKRKAEEATPRADATEGKKVKNKQTMNPPTSFKLST